MKCTVTGVVYENSDLQKYEMMKVGEPLTVKVYGDDAYPLEKSYKLAPADTAPKKSKCVLSEASADFTSDASAVSRTRNC